MRHNVDHGKPGKHCHNCKGLEWGEGDMSDPQGWICNFRNYATIQDENTHFYQLDSEDYRFRGKRCFKDKP